MRSFPRKEAVVGAKLLNLGFGNTVVTARVIAIVATSSAPMKRLKDEAREGGKLIDATQGRKTRSIIITDSDHIILSALQAETIAQRFEGEDSAGQEPGA
jgi:hypothetical protein